LVAEAEEAEVAALVLAVVEAEWVWVLVSERGLATG